MAATDFRTVATYAEERYGIETEYPSMPEERYGFPAFDETFDDKFHRDVTTAGMGATETSSGDGFLATEGLASCIGVAAYSEEAGYGLVSHVVSGDAIDERVPHLEEAFQEYDGDALAVTYVVGNQPDEDVFDDVMATVHDIDIDPDERFVYTGRSGSVALDLDDGDCYTYDSNDDPVIESLLS